MLAELVQLARNIKAQGIAPELAHKDFDRPGLTSHITFLAQLGSTDGELTLDLSALPNDHELALWTLKSGNFKYFPAVRPKSPPLTLAPESNDWALLEKPKGKGFDPAWIGKATEAIKELGAAPNNCPQADLSDGLAKAEQILNWNTGGDNNLLALADLARLYQRLEGDRSLAGKLMFQSSIDLMAKAKNDDEFTAAMTLLIGKRKQPKNKPPEVEYKIQLLFDFHRPGDAAFTIYTHVLRHAVLDQLVNNQDTTKDLQPCLFSAKGSTRLTSPIPKWSAPPTISNGIPPFSKNGAASCNTRYRLSDSDALPIATETAQHLVASLKAATDPAREGINWRAIKNGKHERKKNKTLECSDVLIAFPSLKAGQLKVIDLLAKPAKIDDNNKKQTARARQFETLGKQAIERLGKIVDSGNIHNYVRILLIRQIEKAKIQLAYHATPSTQELKQAIRRWENSGAYLPQSIKVPFLSEKSPTGLTRPLRPNLLFPEEIAQLLSKKWIRDGTDARPIESPPVGDIFDLFLMRSPDERALAEHLLSITLDRCDILLTCAGQALRKGREEWKNHHAKTKTGVRDKKKPDLRYEYARTLSLIGTILHIMKSDPENPLNAAAIRVGKLLAMADELHKQYSIAVRSKSTETNGKIKIDMPTTLIGNGLLSRAGDDPAAAIDDLLDRGRIYIGWAKTQTRRPRSDDQEKASPKDIAINSALKVVRLFQPVADELNKLGIPRELDTESRAHLLLGYLAPVLGLKDIRKKDDQYKTKDNQTRTSQDDE